MGIAPFCFAVFTDLHVGATAANHWHNQFLTDRPADTSGATVAAINRERPDFVAVLGDLSDTASDAELTAARRVLDAIKAPWVVCQGNHDVSASSERGDWDRVFGDRSPIGLLPASALPLPEGVFAVAFEGGFESVDGQWRASIPHDLAQRTLAAVREARPELLLVLCHFPFIRQGEHVRVFGGKNAGTLWDGEALLSELAAAAQATLCFAGHQHFHHIATSSEPRWLHCTTASQAEYPAEFRVVEVAGNSMTIHTLAGAAEIVASAPAPEVTWVAGRPEDREVVWNW